MMPCAKYTTSPFQLTGLYRAYSDPGPVAPSTSSAQMDDGDTSAEAPREAAPIGPGDVGMLSAHAANITGKTAVNQGIERRIMPPRIGWETEKSNRDDQTTRNYGFLITTPYV